MTFASPSQPVNPLARERRMGWGTGVSSGGSLATLPAGITWTGGYARALNRIVEGYSGATVELWKSSPGYQDFTFKANGELDLAAVLSWAGGSLADVYVSRWYDQSGQGNHTDRQTTSANRPTFVIETQSGKPAVYFEDVDFSPARFLVEPTTVAQKLRSATMVMAVRCHDKLSGGYCNISPPAIGVGAVPAGYGPTEGACVLSGGGFTLQVQAMHDAGWMDLNRIPSTSRMQVAGVYASGTGAAGDARNTIIGARAVTTLTGAIANWAGAQLPQGGRLGARGDGQRQGHGWVQAAVLARGGSTSQLAAIRDALNLNLSLRTAEPRILWVCGDSTQTAYEPSNDNKDRAPGVLLDGLQDTYHVRVFAGASRRIDQIDAAAASTSTGVARYATEVGAGTAYCILGAGYNDLYASASLATCQSRINTFVANRKAEGIAKVYVCTMYQPQAPSAFTAPDEATRVSLNAWLDAGSSSADGIVPVAAASWTGKLLSDGVHLNTSGNQQMAEIMRDFLALQP